MADYVKVHAGHISHHFFESILEFVDGDGNLAAEVAIEQPTPHVFILSAHWPGLPSPVYRRNLEDVANVYHVLNLLLNNLGCELADEERDTVIERIMKEN